MRAQESGVRIWRIWRLHLIRSGKWWMLGHIRRVHFGHGRILVGALLGADEDIPLRPWPQYWTERCGRRLVVCWVLCGFGFILYAIDKKPDYIRADGVESVH